MRVVRRLWGRNQSGERAEENAPAPGARKSGSGRKHILKPWMLEVATEHAKKWRGYFSLDDMWEFLQRKCVDDDLRVDCSMDTVWRAMRDEGWAKYRQRVKPHLTAGGGRTPLARSATRKARSSVRTAP